jgi:hypothetical protein
MKLALASFQQNNNLATVLLLALGMTGTAVGQKAGNREFSVPVSEVVIQGREIPTGADLEAIKKTPTDHKAKVVLGPEEHFANISLAPDLKQVSIDGHDVSAVQAPVDTTKSPTVSDGKGGWHYVTPAYRLNTKVLGTLTAVTDEKGNVTRLLLTHQQIEEVSRLGK